MTLQLSHLIACMNNHFACDDQLPADCETWRHLRRHIVRMQNALTLVYLTLRDERELGIPLTAGSCYSTGGGDRAGRLGAYLADLASVLGDARRFAAMVGYCTGLLLPVRHPTSLPGPRNAATTVLCRGSLRCSQGRNRLNALAL